MTEYRYLPVSPLCKVSLANYNTWIVGLSRASMQCFSALTWALVCDFVLVSSPIACLLCCSLLMLAARAAAKSSWGAARKHSGEQINQASCSTGMDRPRGGVGDVQQHNLLSY